MLGIGDCVFVFWFLDLDIGVNVVGSPMPVCSRDEA